MPDPTPSNQTDSHDSATNEPAGMQPEHNDTASDASGASPSVLEYGRKLAAAAAQVALDNRAEDVLVLDVSKQTALFDFFVLATGTSRRQLHAIADEIDDRLQKDLGDKRLGVEGFDESRWIVLDYGSVVVHLFDEEMREYYDLESLWADAKRLSHDDLGLVDHARRTID